MGERGPGLGTNNKTVFFLLQFCSALLQSQRRLVVSWLPSVALLAYICVNLKPFVAKQITVVFPLLTSSLTCTVVFSSHECLDLHDKLFCTG